MKICLNCGNEYISKGKKFCNRSCQRTYLNKLNNPAKSNTDRLKIAKARTKIDSKIILNCYTCKKDFIKYKSELKYRNTNFCSIACRGKWQSITRIGQNAPNKYKKLKRTCKICNKVFKVPPSALLKSSCNFCSLDCWYNYNRGRNHTLWVGGVGFDRGYYWNKIRKQVYKRDNYTCQICYKKDIIINAHHIIPFRYFNLPEKANLLDNLITLCKKCHAKEDSKILKGVKNEINYKKST